MSHLLPPGKVDWRLLQSILGQVELDERVLVGPRVGEDAAVVDMGDRYLVAGADPVTLAGERAGWYLVHVNANDVATMGARPRWLLVTLLLPAASATAEMLPPLFEEIRGACRSVGCTLCGGHTEVSDSVDRPLLIGQMMGEVAKGDLVTSSGARLGDVILLTKSIAIEGTAILSRAAAGRLGRMGFSRACRAGAAYLDEPGISVVKEAMAAVSGGRPSAMHDPTEGGLAAGLHELAEASGVGLAVNRGSIPVLPECAEMCAALGLDSLGLIASGALLITAPAGEAEAIASAVRAAGVSVTDIGVVTSASDGVMIVDSSGESELPAYSQDEIVRVLGHVDE